MRRHVAGVGFGVKFLPLCAASFVSSRANAGTQPADDRSAAFRPAPAAGIMVLYTSYPPIDVTRQGPLVPTGPSK
jgi:hypothetical protein